MFICAFFTKYCLALSSFLIDSTFAMFLNTFQSNFGGRGAKTFFGPFDICPVDMDAFDIVPFDIVPFDIVPFDIVPFDTFAFCVIINYLLL